MPTNVFNPEPVERTQYIAGVFVFPIFLLVFYLFFNQGLKKIQNNKFINCLYYSTYTFMAVAIISLLVVDLKANKFFYFQNNYFYRHPARALFIYLFMLILLYLGQKFKKPRIFKFIAYFSDGLSFVFIIVTFLITLITIYSFNDSGPFTINFNAVFYSMSQVYGGKALLVDLTNQYGLYPQFLEPIFRVTGLSVFKFSLTMAFMMLLIFFSFYKVIREATSNRFLGFLGFTTLIYYGYFFIKFVSPEDTLYYQYYPIRVIFPAIMVFFAWKYFNNHNKFLYYFSFFSASISVLWNMDTGAVLFLTWFLSLFFEEAFTFDLKLAVKKIGVHFISGISILAFTIFSYAIYIWLRYGSWPDFYLLTAYQKLFYIYGLNMLPMRLVDPWNSVLLVYGIGLIYSIKKLVNRSKSPKTTIVFFLSILGFGIFSYYQGRSHDFVLTAVWYPAFILLAIFVDELFSNLKKNPRNIAAVILFLMMFCILSSSVFSLIGNYKVVGGLLKTRIQPAQKTEATSFIRSVNFIKKHTHKSDEVLILSYNSGVYYLESGTVSPLKIPGLTELTIKKDYQKILDYLNNNHSKNVILDKAFISYLPANQEVVKVILQNYKVQSESPDGNIIVYRRDNEIPKLKKVRGKNE